VAIGVWDKNIVHFCPAVVKLTTFYDQLLCQYYWAKKLQTQTVFRGKLGKALSYTKGCSKMLVKLTPGSWQSCLGGHDLCEFDMSAVVVVVVGKVG